jgi:hypothetical protein
MSEWKIVVRMKNFLLIMVEFKTNAYLNQNRLPMIFSVVCLFKNVRERNSYCIAAISIFKNSGIILLHIIIIIIIITKKF